MAAAVAGFEAEELGAIAGLEQPQQQIGAPLLRPGELGTAIGDRISPLRGCDGQIAEGREPAQIHVVSLHHRTRQWGAIGEAHRSLHEEAVFGVLAGIVRRAHLQIHQREHLLRRDGTLRLGDHHFGVVQRLQQQGEGIAGGNLGAEGGGIQNDRVDPIGRAAAFTEGMAVVADDEQCAHQDARQGSAAGALPHETLQAPLLLLEAAPFPQPGVDQLGSGVCHDANRIGEVLLGLKERHERLGGLVVGLARQGDRGAAWIPLEAAPERFRQLLKFRRGGL